MSFANPTSLRIGATGNLAGKTYRVAGRVVMGMEDGGETYYWNEFNLTNNAGDHATLVFEETERGWEWKLFIYLDDQDVMSASEAARKRVGDQLTLDGKSVYVSLVDESRVYHIEGEAPEGVEAGDVANYFNAESGNTMIVVSWTGEEVEYYRGIHLARGTVARAFKISEQVNAAFADGGGYSGGSSAFVGKSSFNLFIGLCALLVAIFFAVFFFQSPLRMWNQARPAIKRFAVPDSNLKPDASLKIGETRWRVRTARIFEIAEVARASAWREYELDDADGNRAWLIHGFKPGADEWSLFTPLTPSEPMPPTQAAALRVGETINVDGVIVPITRLFQITGRVESFAAPEVSAAKRDDALFGFIGEMQPNLLLVRWNSGNIQFMRGRTLGSTDLEAIRKGQN